MRGAPYEVRTKVSTGLNQTTGHSYTATVAAVGVRFIGPVVGLDKSSPYDLGAARLSLRSRSVCVGQTHLNWKVQGNQTVTNWDPNRPDYVSAKLDFIHSRRSKIPCFLWLFLTREVFSMSQSKSGEHESTLNAQIFKIFAHSVHPKWIKSS